MNGLQCARLLLMTLLISLAGSIAQADGSRQKANIIIPENSKSIYDAWGFAPAVEIDNVIYVSGVIVALQGEGTYEARYERGFKAALAAIGAVLGEAGASMDDIVEFTTFHTDLQRQLPTAVAVRKREMNPPHPAWTAVGTTALAMAEGVTEIKVIAHRSK